VYEGVWGEGAGAVSFVPERERGGSMVGDAPDKWVPLVCAKKKKGRERECAGGLLRDRAGLALGRSS
jgi:hypothetical protein